MKTTKNNPIYFVYRITHLLKNKHYYGSKTAKNSHLDMLGTIYFSSSFDKEFIKE